MFWAAVAARMVYWIRFLKFAVVGMVGIGDGEWCDSPGLIYLLLGSSHRYFPVHSQHHIIQVSGMAPKITSMFHMSQELL
jgi:putative flippase GtrA